MSLCVSCGALLSGDESLCLLHHHGAYPDGWATANRIMCDFVHRRIVPSRLRAADRDSVRPADEDRIVLAQAHLVMS